MRRLLNCLALVALVFVPVNTASGQIPSIKKKAEEAAKKKAAEDAARKAKADSAAKADSTARADSAKVKEGPGQPAAPANPKVWENYDFVPGSKVIFFTDFSEDKVGNFARGLKFKAGAMDVVERDGVKMLRSTNRGEFFLPVGKKLPERFTLEIDVISPRAPIGGYDHLAFEGGSAWDRSEKSVEVNWTAEGMLLMGGGQNAGSSTVKFPENVAAQNLKEVTHLRVLMDGEYFKLYNNERRIYNIPELAFKRDSVIRFLLKGGEEPDQATYIAAIRVAESEVDVLYDALNAKGRWVTQGILFATGKADLQPESTPVLKEIASTLKKYPDLKILIEGHTDNVGQPASNLALSDARAAAVKAALTSQYGIDGARVTTKGFGDTKPSVPNTSATNRAQNRRVEIVKT